MRITFDGNGSAGRANARARQPVASTDRRLSRMRGSSMAQVTSTKHRLDVDREADLHADHRQLRPRHPNVERQEA
jgi:hypothetical protein